MDSELLLSPHSSTPMYAQIVEQVVAKVMAGAWRAGDVLPSIRELAGNSRVSVITVKRAYLELERDGVILTRQGKGSFVADSAGLSTRLHHDELNAHLSAAAEIGRVLGLSPSALEQRLRDAVRKRDEKKR